MAKKQVKKTAVKKAVKKVAKVVKIAKKTNAKPVNKLNTKKLAPKKLVLKTIKKNNVSKIDSKKTINTKLAVYNHLKIEGKWQKKWEASGVYKTDDKTLKAGQKKFYVLDMFPYPSGEGLHVGHPKGYIATDVVSRMKRMSGNKVLHPMGWDAFGLPAEQFAIKNKTNPMIGVKKTVARFKKQISIIGLDYDWNREINTTDPKYYKWTQWTFLKMMEHGLTYESNEPINWCPSCKTGLANEDLEDGKCERCGSVIEKKPLRQWVIKITKYADRLLKDLETLDWPEPIKDAQRNWIGRSEGSKLTFELVERGENISIKLAQKLEVFTTRPDTLYGVTYVVVAPEAQLVANLKDKITNWKEVEKYISEAKMKTEIDRTSEGKEKTGVRLDGIFAVHPITKMEVPVFVADYVLAGYGTGAVMAVAAHDTRDYDFAKKYNLEIKEVIKKPGEDTELPYIENGVMVNSSQFNGRKNTDIFEEITKLAGGKREVIYRLKDWVFSRQRYWGEPIPVIHCEKCGVVPVPYKDLPVVLPKVKSYEPTGTGESPLANIKSWVNVKCPKCKGAGKRETNTMPQWAGSSWYYLRYMDSKNDKALVDPKKEEFWSPVDFYVGGAEHAARHLIYARFWHKFLKDIGVVKHSEPFKKLQNVGLIMGEDGRKMSKRYGNVVNPDSIVETYGADSLRLYEMFMGPFDQEISWKTDNIMGVRRFVERVWRLQERVLKDAVVDEVTEIVFNQTIKKVTEDIDVMGFNTAISQMMICLNQFEKNEKIPRSMYLTFIKLIAPFAPHFTEEIWSIFGEKGSVHLASWPNYDANKLVLSTVTIVVQINGKVRAQFDTKIDLAKDVLEKMALECEYVKNNFGDKMPNKIIVVPNKLVNLVY